MALGRLIRIHTGILRVFSGIVIRWFYGDKAIDYWIKGTLGITG